MGIYRIADERLQVVNVMFLLTTIIQVCKLAPLFTLVGGGSHMYKRNHLWKADAGRHESGDDASADSVEL